MLDVDTTNDLIRKAKQGDGSAKETLIVENNNLIKSIVRRYLNKGVEYDDLYQLASMGLLKAINGFDEAFGVRFSTYAVPMIAGEIKRFMRDDGSIKVSRAIKNTAKQINKFIEDYSVIHGAQPSVKKIAEEFDMPESEVVFTMGSTRMPVSIYNQGEYKDEKGQELLEKLPVADNQEDIIDSLQLKTAIDGLPDRDKKVIILRYFRDMTQSEVATMLGVSQVQVSRIENRIMENFRKSLTG
ncbi:MAG: SigB/SigF/SigG family RNA polymerase sigma factor [Clostridia bacterium]|nr:SigB/SigF/SigG family RNA polymerase sigma factor [Clostridia bacterium]